MLPTNEKTLSKDRKHSATHDRRGSKNYSGRRKIREKKTECVRVLFPKVMDVQSTNPTRKSVTKKEPQILADDNALHCAYTFHQKRMFLGCKKN